MKNIFKNLAILSALLFTFSCDKNPDNTIYEVLEYETGAILRTISVENALLNSSIPSTEFVVIVEEQDEQDGALFESVDVYVTIRDLSPDNGTTPPSEAKVKTIPASEFSTGPVGLPRGTVRASFGESVAAMGLGPDDYAPGDLFVMELRVNLTDGRTFGAKDAGGIITGGFFSSPYKYNVLLVCSPEPGDYTVVMQDSYGDGWQTNDGNGGDGIHVDLDGTIVVVGMCSPYGGSNVGTEMDEDEGLCTPNDGYGPVTKIVTIPVGTESATWNFPGDAYGEISFAVYGPAGQLLYEAGLGEASPGLLPITLCAQ